MRISDWSSDVCSSDLLRWSDGISSSTLLRRCLLRRRPRRALLLTRRPGRRRAALLRGFRLRLLDRFLERRHQVDDVRGAAPRRLVLLLDDLAVALRFALARDQFVERVDIAVVEFLRVERRGLLLDQRLGEVEQFGVGPGVGEERKSTRLN